jgi:hypothetical protein
MDADLVIEFAGADDRLLLGGGESLPADVPGVVPADVPADRGEGQLATRPSRPDPSEGEPA